MPVHLNAFSADLFDVCIAGLGNLFGERNLRLHMEKSEERKVVETELWDRFEHYVYVTE